MICLAVSSPQGSGFQSASIVVPQDGYIGGIDSRIWLAPSLSTEQIFSGVSIGEIDAAELEVPGCNGSTQWLAMLTYSQVAQAGSTSSYNFGQSAHFTPARIRVNQGTQIWISHFVSLGSVTVARASALIHFFTLDEVENLRKPIHVAKVATPKTETVRLSIPRNLQAELRSHVLTGWGAFEACTDVVTAVIDAAQTITENAFWFLTGIDLLQANVELSASELVGLLGLWSTAGADGLEGAIGPLGFLTEQTGSSPGGEILTSALPDTWKKTLADNAIQIAVEAVQRRYLQQNNPRHKICPGHYSRKLQ